jgi:hypothetical protein
MEHNIFEGPTCILMFSWVALCTNKKTKKTLQWLKLQPGTLSLGCIQHLNEVPVHVEFEAYFWTRVALKHLAQFLHHAFSDKNIKCYCHLFQHCSQLSSLFTKDTSCSDPLNSRISTASRWFNKSSSVFQFDGWSQIQPVEHAVCAWNEEHVLVKLWLILHHNIKREEPPN